MRSGSPEEILDSLKSPHDILLPAGCANPQQFVKLLTDKSDRLNGCRLWSGLLVGEYPFAREPHPNRLRYGTWHVMRPVESLIASGRADYYPLRSSHVGDFIKRREIAEVVILNLSPPDSTGSASLGVSTGYSYDALSVARVVIGQINPLVPATCGNCRIPVTDLTYSFTLEEPLPEYTCARVDETSRRIATLIEPLIPPGATIQIGIGSIPEALLLVLKESRLQDLSFWGMAAEGLVALDEGGMLKRGPGPAVVAVELMGSGNLFRWAANNPRCIMVPFSVGSDSRLMSARPNFISINSAIEIDLWGNVNAEVVEGRQVSGVGGSLDFVEGARRSEGGKSIIALPATAKGGTVSRIVAELSSSPTMPRNLVQYVVTEFGCVDLSLLSLDSRAEAMISLAAPQRRNDLYDAYRARQKKHLPLR